MNKSLQALLSLFADGEFHSGSTIGAAIGVSRTAVWKHLKKLAELGLPIEAVKGKGYRLPGGLELLDLPAIQDALTITTEQHIPEIELFMQIDSTNDVAMSHALSSDTTGYACFAESQQAGRGRRGRHWVSPFGHNIYMSVVWGFDGGATQLEGLSLSVGVVVANILEELGLQNVSLKWPNDILLSGRKLGGVLLEMVGDPAGVCKVVIGIGLNVMLPEGAAIDQPWASIEQQIHGVSKNQLAASLLNGLVPMLREYHVGGFSIYQDRWQGLDAYRGQRVVVVSEQKRVEGIACGVVSNGGLRLLVGDEEKVIYGGEVSLRLTDAP